MVSFSSPVSTLGVSKGVSRLAGPERVIRGVPIKEHVPVLAWKRSSVFSATKVSLVSPLGSASVSLVGSALSVLGAPNAVSLSLGSLSEEGRLGEAKLVTLPEVPARGVAKDDPDGRPPKPKPEVPLREKAEPVAAELKAELEKDDGTGAVGSVLAENAAAGVAVLKPKGEAAGLALLKAKGEAAGLALFKAKGEPAEACPKALAVKA